MNIYNQASKQYLHLTLAFSLFCDITTAALTSMHASNKHYGTAWLTVCCSFSTRCSSVYCEPLFVFVSPGVVRWRWWPSRRQVILMPVETNWKSWRATVFERAAERARRPRAQRSCRHWRGPVQGRVTHRVRGEQWGVSDALHLPYMGWDREHRGCRPRRGWRQTGWAPPRQSAR